MILCLSQIIQNFVEISKMNNEQMQTNKTGQRYYKQSSYIKQSPTQFNLPEIQDIRQVFAPHQQTLRMRRPEHKTTLRRILLQNGGEEEQDYTEPIFDLTNQNLLKKEALERASQIISFLEEQNTFLNSQLTVLSEKYKQNNHEYNRMTENYKKHIQNCEQKIKDLEEKSTRNQSTVLSAPRSGRYTPVNFYNKGEEQDYLTPLTQIEKSIIHKRIEELESELKGLQSTCSYEQEVISGIVDQQQSLYSYFEDYNMNDKIVNLQQDLKQNHQKIELYQKLVHQHQATIRKWQKYANSLKMDLMESFQFIEKMGTLSSVDGKLRDFEYNNQDLVEFIGGKVMTILWKQVEKGNKQNKELRQLLEEMIGNLKKRKQPGHSRSGSSYFG